MSKEKYVLAEVEPLSSVFSPLKTSNRIKYTCFSVSQNFLVLGATSGGLYVFKRESCTFLQLLPNKEGTITHVSISPNEKLFGFATAKGLVSLLDRNESPGSRRIITSTEHLGSNITALKWNSHSSELYVGDNMGRVSVITVSFFSAKTVFHTPALTLMQLDSCIIQIDWCEEILLVSTFTRCYLCDTINEQYRQIGVKLREGEYGACFYYTRDYQPILKPENRVINFAGAFMSISETDSCLMNEELKYVKIFCARPGSRLWEVQIDGTVVSTHQFKEALAISPTKAIKVEQTELSCEEMNSRDISWNQQSFNFVKLLTLSRKFLFTFRSDGIYIFNPEEASVVLWNNEYDNISDVKVFQDCIYIWTSTGEMHVLALYSLEKFLVKLYLKESYLLCAQLCSLHRAHLLERAPVSLKLSVLLELGKKINDSELLESIMPLLNEISKYNPVKQTASKLKSGIFIVENSHFLQRNAEVDLTEKCEVSIVVSNESQEKSRSLSSSPSSSRRHLTAVQHSISSENSPCGSTMSLPELIQSSEKNIDCAQKIKSSGESDSSSIECSPQKTKSVSPTGGSGTLLTSVTSPETVKALKEISHSVSEKFATSTKVLKKKWHMLEDKVKSLGQEEELNVFQLTCEDLEVKPINDKEIKIVCSDLNCLQGKVSSDEIVHTDLTRNNQNICQLPKLDVSEIIDLCIEFEDHKNKDVYFLPEIILRKLYSVFEKFQNGLNQNLLPNREGCKHSENNNETISCKHEIDVSSMPTSGVVNDDDFDMMNGRQERTNSRATEEGSSLGLIKGVCLNVEKNKNELTIAKPKIENLSDNIVVDNINFFSDIENDINFNCFLNFKSNSIIKNALTVKEKPALNSLNRVAFPFSTYFSNEIMKSLKRVLTHLLNSQSIVNIIETFQRTEGLVIVPIQLNSIHEERDLKIDAILAELFTMCSDLLDPNDCLNCLKSLNLNCYYSCLSSILDNLSSHYKEDFDEEMQPLLKLNTVYTMLLLDQVDVCLSLETDISVKDIYYLSLRKEQKLVNDGVSVESAKYKSNYLFLSYLRKYLVSDDVLKSTFNDNNLRYIIINVFKQINQNSGFSCKCGFPVSLPPDPKFLEIGHHILNNFVDQGNAECFQYLQNVPGLWQSYLNHMLSRADVRLDEVLPLVIHLGDTSSLERFLSVMNLECWESTLSRIVKFNCGTCLNCDENIINNRNHKPVSWSDFGIVLVKCLGPQEALKLLMKYSDNIKPGDLNIMFFQSCIFSEIIDKYSTGLRSKVVNMLQTHNEKLDRTSVFSPKVTANVEKSLKKDLGKVPEVFRPKHSVRHHWGYGVNLKDGLCPCCSLPLDSQVLLKESGLTVFRCGHSYHLVCAQQRKNFHCLLCERESVT